MTENLIWVALALSCAGLVVMFLVLARLPARGDDQASELARQLAPLQEAGERQERELRDQVQASARDTRAEIQQTLALFQQTLMTQAGDVARTQNEQIDSFRVQLAAMQQQLALSLQASAQSLTQQAQSSSQTLTQTMVWVKV